MHKAINTAFRKRQKSYKNHNHCYFQKQINIFVLEFYDEFLCKQHT